MCFLEKRLNDWFDRCYENRKIRQKIQPPTSKIFVTFIEFTLKNCIYIVDCQVNLAIICPHFVCWLLAAHTKSEILEITYTVL